MKDMKSNLDPSGEEIIAPGWMAEALERLRPSPSFERKCEEVALLGYSIEKLRRERDQRGFLPISLGAYLKRLAQYARIDLAPVLEWAEVSYLPLTLEGAPKLAYLLKLLGFARDESLALIRVSFGEELGYYMLPPRIAYHGGVGEPTDLQRCELALEEVEQRYTAEARHNLTKLLSVIQSEFERESA